MNYTEKLESNVFEIWDDDSDVIVDKVLSFLEDKSTFRNFGEGLKFIIRNTMPNDEQTSEIDYFKQCVASKGIVLNRNTIKNWFDGTRPKKGEKSREQMYLIAFALGLSIDDTYKLFMKVYYDRPFNMRNIHEFVYYYCLKNGYGYDRAQNIINDIKMNTGVVSESIYDTQLIKNTAQVIADDSEVVEYVSKHIHNFGINNKSQVRILNKLLDEIKATDEEKLELKKGKIDIKNSSYSYIVRELSVNDMLLDKNKNIVSVSSMLDAIIGIDIVKNTKQTNKTIFKDSFLPQEIVNRFPSKHTFSKVSGGSIDIPSEEIRKAIILLFSYKYWFECQYNDYQADIDDYKEEADNILFSADLQGLYWGNPFDWLFLYCSAQEMPLDCFRDIMQEVYYKIGQ